MFCRCPSASGEHGGPLPAEGAAGTFLVRGWSPWEPGYPADGNANLLNALPQPLPAMLLLIKLNLIMQITHPTLTHIRGTYLLPAPAVSFLQQTHQLLFRVLKQARAKPAAQNIPAFSSSSMRKAAEHSIELERLAALTTPSTLSLQPQRTSEREQPVLQCSSWLHLTCHPRQPVLPLQVTVTWKG